jgi:cohesin complex subunit SCC1
MKTQLSDTTDIVGVLELAPPTRRLMHLKETGGIEKLFSLSATSIYSKTLQQVREKLFVRLNTSFSIVNYT